MATTYNTHTRAGSVLRLGACAGLAVVALLAASLDTPRNATAATVATTADRPADGSTYGWPVKPFFGQHPVRGSFGDPRILGKSHSFHFGVDVSCPNGTPVYATVSGCAYVYPGHPETVSVKADDGVRTFGYWHIRPSIRNGQRVTAYRTVIGTVLAPWEHVHFAEQRKGVYVNPLRAGGMGPYRDTTVPMVRSFTVETGSTARRATTAHGRVDLVVEAYDRTPISISGPWHDKPLSPARLEWRLVGRDGAVKGWRTAVDFRMVYPPNERWSETYASRTRQNKKIWDARYRFYLVHDLNTRTLADGRYRVEVRATDIRGNAGTETFTLTVANDI